MNECGTPRDLYLCLTNDGSVHTVKMEVSRTADGQSGGGGDTGCPGRGHLPAWSPHLAQTLRPQDGERELVPGTLKDR